MTQTRPAPIPAGFARTGLVVQRAGPVPTRFQVLGERSSGTNFVKRLLGRNSALRPTEALGWKHGTPSAIAIPADLAVICVVRNAADWALSMHAKPWHATPALQALPFSQFIRAEWHSVIDRQGYFPGAADPGVLGRPLQADRDPATGAAHDNLFALRRGKLAGLLSHLNRECTCALLRLEAVQADPEAMLDALLDGLGQPPRGAAFRPVFKRLGARFRPAVAGRPATPQTLPPEDRAFLARELDSVQETALGYVY